MVHRRTPRNGRQTSEAQHDENTLCDERSNIGRRESVQVQMNNDEKLCGEEHERGDDGKGTKIISPRRSAPEEEVGDLHLKEGLCRK